MNYLEKKNEYIRIDDLSQFDVNHILDCGQVFRYRNEADCTTVYSKNKICLLQKRDGYVIMKTDDTDYFARYFDLSRDYEQIKRELGAYRGLAEALEFGKGIRILNQDPLETIISFIISANNNIPRIKSIIERICAFLGEDMGGYRAFPTVERLSQADESFYKSIGAGYRASYLVKTSRALLDYDLNRPFGLSTAAARKELMSFCGIGGKVADCILLFAYGKTDLFPMDTWSKKIYKALGFPEEHAPSAMSERLVEHFGNLSGYAQQYLYYYFRSNKSE